MTKRADPRRIVVGADVLAADVFIDGKARAVMDILRAHDWIEVAASDHLLSHAEATINRLGERSLATAWRDRIERLVVPTEHPPEDHPGLASAYAAGAAHLLSYDDRLTSVDAGLAMRRAMPISIRTPPAFLAVFDPETVFEATFDEPYPGPDRDPRG